jgi:SAM-dependent methyltransferase
MAIENLLFILCILLIILAGIYFLWLIIPIISGLPWIPTQPLRIRRALELAQLSPGEVFYDLGSGDGRALVLAAKEFGAYAIGVEISPIHCFVTWINALIHGVSKRVEIRWNSFYRVDIRDADIIFIFMTAREASRLRPRLENQLHPGARVITISCEMSGWQPTIFNREELIFIYRMGSLYLS